MRSRALVAATLGVAVGVCAAGSAAAAPFTLGPDLKISGPSTLTACPFGASSDFAAAYNHTEVEPQVAVDPTNPAQIVGVSQQDRWPDGGARGLSSWILAQRRRLTPPSSPTSRGAPVKAARCGLAASPIRGRPTTGRATCTSSASRSTPPRSDISAISVTTFNGTTWRAPQILIEDVGHPWRHQRQGLDHRRPDPRRLRLRHLDPLQPPRRPEERPSCRLPLVRVPRRADDLAHHQRRRHLVAAGTDAPVEHIHAGQPDRRRARRHALRRPPRTCSAVRVSPTSKPSTWASCAPTTPGSTGRRPSRSRRSVPPQLFVPDDHFPIRAEDYLPDIAIDPRTTATLRRVVRRARDTDRQGRHGQVDRRRPALERAPPSSPPAARTCSPTTTPIEVTPDGTSS